MTQHTKTNYRKGFNIVEIAMILTIVGIIAFGTINAGMMQLEVAQVKQTEHKLEKIENAITLYFKTYGYLPCPADGTLASTHANFGVDQITDHNGSNLGASGVGPTAVDCTTSSNLRSAATHPDVYVGVIPVTTLGLPDEYMYDGWGNRITYIISRYCVAKNNWQLPSSTFTNTYKCAQIANSGTTTDTTSGGAIDIAYTTAGGNWTLTPKPVYMLISHGRNGLGAWDKTGNRRTGTGFGTEERYNANLQVGGTSVATTSANTSYRQLIQNDGVVTPTDYFDDQIRFRTATQLYYDAN